MCLVHDHHQYSIRLPSAYIVVPVNDKDDYGYDHSNNDNDSTGNDTNGHDGHGGMLIQLGENHYKNSFDNCDCRDIQSIVNAYTNINTFILSQQVLSSSFTPISSLPLRSLASLPTLRRNGTYVRLTATGRTHEILVYGGTHHEITDQHIASVECYNTITNQWSTETNILPVVGHITGWAIDPATHNLYTFGGWSDIARTYVDAVQCYNQHTRTWSVLTCRMNDMKRDITSAIYIPSLHGILIAGGSSDGYPNNSLYCYNPILEFYDPDNNTFTAIPVERLSLPSTDHRIGSFHLIDKPNLHGSSSSSTGTGTMLVMMLAGSDTPFPTSPAKGSRARTMVRRAPCHYPLHDLDDYNRRTGFILDISSFHSIDELISGKGHDNGNDSKGDHINNINTSTLQWCWMPPLPYDNDEHRHRYELTSVVIPQ
jgi:hypothetical protein